MKKPPALKQTAGLMKGEGRNTCQDPQNSGVVCQVGLPQRLEAARMLAAVACKCVVGSGIRF